MSKGSTISARLDQNNFIVANNSQRYPRALSQKYYPPRPYTHGPRQLSLTEERDENGFTVPKKHPPETQFIAHLFVLIVGGALLYRINELYFKKNDD